MEKKTERESGEKESVYLSEGLLYMYKYVYKYVYVNMYTYMYLYIHMYKII